MTKLSKSTQEFISIKEIRDGVVILNSGAMRMVLIASSLNFSLKSNDERVAILSEYQNFLNSLDFEMQIFIQSRKLDIRPYIGTIEERLKEQTNELIKIQNREYIEFIKSFTESTNVMTKNFFIVIPYSPPVFQGKDSFLSRFGLKSPSKSKQPAQTKLDNFAENKIQLEQRTAVVEQGLSRIGINVAPLGTEELVELYFKIFHQGERDMPSIS